MIKFSRNQIQFAPFSSLEMQKEAHIHVVSKNLYSQDAARTPAPFGVLDPKLVIEFLFFLIVSSFSRVFVVVNVYVIHVIKM